MLAIFTIYKNFNHLIEDAPELIHKYLEEETVGGQRKVLRIRPFSMSFLTSAHACPHAA